MTILMEGLHCIASPSLSLSSLLCRVMHLFVERESRLLFIGALRGRASASTQHPISPSTSPGPARRLCQNRRARYRLSRGGPTTKMRFMMQVTSNMMWIVLDHVNAVSFPKCTCPVTNLNKRMAADDIYYRCATRISWTLSTAWDWTGRHTASSITGKCRAAARWFL